MANKYYYNRRKERWSSNMNDLSVEAPADQAGKFFKDIKLCENPAQNANSVSQQFTVKNFEIQFQMIAQNPANFDQVSLYIMYCPQGMTVTEDFAKNHPEYILGWKYFGGPESSASINRNPLNMKSRLSRKLNTGDKIVLFITGDHAGATRESIYIKGVVRWNAKSN